MFLKSPNVSPHYQDTEINSITQLVSQASFCPKQINCTQLDNKHNVDYISGDALCSCQRTCTVTIKALAFPVELEKLYCTSVVIVPGHISHQ